MKKLKIISFLSTLILLFFLGNKFALAKTDILFTPPQIQPAVNQTANLDLKIDSTDQILGIDLIIKYDQTAVSIESFAPGSFWSNPQVVINKIDSQNGKAYFSLFHYPAKTGIGSLGNLTLRLISTKGSTVSIDGSTTIAGPTGQKITASFKEAVIAPINSSTIAPTVFQSPTSTNVSPTVNPQPTQGINISATVSAPTESTQIGPTIILEGTPTPQPQSSKPSTSFILQVAALFLLIFGTLAFFTFKKNF